MAEYFEARRLQKKILTVQVRGRTHIPEDLSQIQYVDLTAGVENPKALTRLYASIAKLSERVPKKPLKPLSNNRTPLPRIPSPAEEARATTISESELPDVHRYERPSSASLSNRRLFLFIAVIVVAVVGGAVLAASGAFQQPLDPVSQALTRTSEAEVATIIAGIILTTNEEQTATAATLTAAPTATVLLSTTPTPTDTPTLTATLADTSTEVPTSTLTPPATSTPPATLTPALTVTPRWPSGQRLSIHNPNGAWLRGIPDSYSHAILQILPDKATVIIAGGMSYDGSQYWWEVSAEDGRYIGWIEEASLGEYVPPPPTNTPRPRSTAATISTQRSDTSSSADCPMSRLQPGMTAVVLRGKYPDNTYVDLLWATGGDLGSLQGSGLPIGTRLILIRRLNLAGETTAVDACRYWYVQVEGRDIFGSTVEYDWSLNLELVYLLGPA